MEKQASELLSEGAYRIEGRQAPAEELIELYARWAAEYPVFSIEDGLDEDDWEGWTALYAVAAVATIFAAPSLLVGLPSHPLGWVALLVLLANAVLDVLDARAERHVFDRVELAGDHPRRQAGVGGEHLVGGDHWKPMAQRQHDPGVDTGDRVNGQDEVDDLLSSLGF